MTLPYEYFVIELLAAVKKGKKIKNKKKKEKSSIIHVDTRMIAGKTLRDILMHILVCAKCNSYLEGFLTLLLKTLMKYNPLKCLVFFNRNTSGQGLHRGRVTAAKYTLDGDFDQLLLDAYNGTEDHCVTVEIFMCKYF